MARKKTAKKSTRASKKAAKKAVKSNAKKTAKKAAKRAVKKTARKAAKKAVKKTANKKVAKVTKKSAKKVAKKVAKKSARKAIGKNKEQKIEAPDTSAQNEKQDKAPVVQPQDLLNDALTTIGKFDFFQDESDECLERGCDSPSNTGNFCRFHYIKNWKEIKKKEAVLKSGQLQTLIRTLVEKHPPAFMEEVLSDLTDEKSFFSALEGMDIDATDESFDEFGDEASGDDQDMAFETKVGNKVGFDD